MASFLRCGCSRVCNSGVPCDVYFNHTCTSFVFDLSWKDTSRVSCRRCGIRQIPGGIAWTMFFGWWHLFRFVAAPWQMLNGFKELRSQPNKDRPSGELEKMIKLDLAKQVNA